MKIETGRDTRERNLEQEVDSVTYENINLHRAVRALARRIDELVLAGQADQDRIAELRQQLTEIETNPYQLNILNERLIYELAESRSGEQAALELAQQSETRASFAESANRDLQTRLGLSQRIVGLQSEDIRRCQKDAEDAREYEKILYSDLSMAQTAVLLATNKPTTNNGHSL